MTQLRKGITHWQDKRTDGKIVNFKAEITEQKDGRASCAVFMNETLLPIDGKDLLRMFPSFEIAKSYIEKVKEQIEKSNSPDSTPLRSKQFTWTDYDQHDKQVKVVVNVQEHKHGIATISIQFSNDPTPEVVNCDSWTEAIKTTEALAKAVQIKNIKRN